MGSEPEADATLALNKAMSSMFRGGLWLKQDVGHRVGQCLQCFLANYMKAAQLTLQAGKRRFGVTPKVHMVHHTCHQLLSQSAVADWVMNPASQMCQIQEDFIGRPSRVSRRVSIKTVHKSLLYRSLIIYQGALERSDNDDRHMDAYTGEPRS